MSRTDNGDREYMTPEQKHEQLRNTIQDLISSYDSRLALNFKDDEMTADAILSAISEALEKEIQECNNPYCGDECVDLARNELKSKIQTILKEKEMGK